ncbi:CRISPR-associated protein Cas2 [Agrobacterium fabrum]|uniref:CRISPR-associated protein Cas2 n=1 Tax=Agrobacterium fabrum TaxID=1176649 RepID=UPI0015728E97|nr:CRISPR-associated protein Cas2 [Agrobacterium fabrum]WCK77576.1 CRISPR-associated protein Cas2 [Agrobacterium fabrum]
MTAYLISYDLIKRKDYPKLWEELERLGAHRTLESLWLINANVRSQELLDHFLSFIDSDDKIWVTEVTRNHAYKGAIGGTTDWLKANPPSR